MLLCSMTRLLEQGSLLRVEFPEKCCRKGWWGGVVLDGAWHASLRSFPAGPSVTGCAVGSGCSEPGPEGLVQLCRRGQVRPSGASRSRSSPARMPSCCFCGGFDLQVSCAFRDGAKNPQGKHIVRGWAESGCKSWSLLVRGVYKESSDFSKVRRA